MLFILSQNRTAPFRRNVRNAEGVPIRAIEFIPREPTEVAAEDVAVLRDDITKRTVRPCTINTFGKAVIQDELADQIAAAKPEEIAALIQAVEAQRAAQFPAAPVPEDKGDADEVPPPPTTDPDPNADNSADAPPSDAKKSKKSKK